MASSSRTTRIRSRSRLRSGREISGNNDDQDHQVHGSSSRSRPAAAKKQNNNGQPRLGQFCYAKHKFGSSTQWYLCLIIDEDRKGKQLVCKDTMLPDREPFLTSKVVFVSPCDDVSEVHGVDEVAKKYNIDFKVFDDVTNLHELAPGLVDTLKTGGQNAQAMLDAITDGTVDNEEQAQDDQLPNDEVDTAEDGTDVVADVVASVLPVLRLADYIKSQSFPITKEEVLRRMSPPESYSITNITSYMRLRRGTNVNQLLVEHGIDAGKGNRCKITNSPYLKLCERECRELAKGIMEVDTEYFPVRDAALVVASYNTPHGPSADHMGPAEDRRNLVVKARAGLNLVKYTLTTMDNMTTYSKATHGFGMQHLINAIVVIDNILKESAVHLEFPEPELSRNCVCGSEVKVEEMENGKGRIECSNKAVAGTHVRERDIDMEGGKYCRFLNKK